MTEAQCSNWSRPKTCIVGTLSFSEMSDTEKPLSVAFMGFVSFYLFFNLMHSIRVSTYFVLGSILLNRHVCYHL